MATAVMTEGNDRGGSQPNISQMGFIDETPYQGPGTRFQVQREGVGDRIKAIIEEFPALRLVIGDWDRF